MEMKKDNVISPYVFRKVAYNFANAHFQFSSTEYEFSLFWSSEKISV